MGILLREFNTVFEDIHFELLVCCCSFSFVYAGFMQAKCQTHVVSTHLYAISFDYLDYALKFYSILEINKLLRCTIFWP